MGEYALTVTEPESNISPGYAKCFADPQNPAIDKNNKEEVPHVLQSM
jgi:hypothetical protein